MVGQLVGGVEDELVERKEAVHATGFNTVFVSLSRGIQISKLHARMGLNGMGGLRGMSKTGGRLAGFYCDPVSHERSLF